MCKYWETAQELGSVVSRSLIMLQRKHPGIGWVKGDLIPDKESTIEILELKKEIERLKRKLEEARTQAPPGTEKLAQGEDIFEINYKCESEKDYQDYNWSGVVHPTWEKIFYYISPRLLTEATDAQIKRYVNQLVEETAIPELTKDTKLKGHVFSKFAANQDDYHTIIIQLRALGLITQSNKSRSLKDTDTYWTLTPYGDSVMNKLRAIERDGEA